MIPGVDVEEVRMNPEFTEICYVVRNFEASIMRWAKLTGAGPFYSMDSTLIPERTYRGQPATDRFTAAVGFMGSTLMEFIQPHDNEPSIFQEVLQKKGEAIQHIYPRMRVLTAKEYDEQCAHYEKAGYKVASTAFMPGIGRNHFFDALDDFGFFLKW